MMPAVRCTTVAMGSGGRTGRDPAEARRPPAAGAGPGRGPSAAAATFWPATRAGPSAPRA